MSVKQVRNHIKKCAKKVKLENPNMSYAAALNVVARLMGYSSYNHLNTPPKESYSKSLTKIIMDDLEEHEPLPTPSENFANKIMSPNIAVNASAKLTLIGTP